jgi:hypothetical protein
LLIATNTPVARTETSLYCIFVLLLLSLCDSLYGVEAFGTGRLVENGKTPSWYDMVPVWKRQEKKKGGRRL